MNEAQFEEFLHEARRHVQLRNEVLKRGYGIFEFARWDHDGDAGRLTFSNPNAPDTVVANTTDIGSYSFNSKSWLWAWANDSLADAEREKAAALKGLFDTTGMRLFTDEHFECDEFVAWEMAAVSVRHLGGIGSYRGTVGHLWIFWCIDTVAEVRRDG